nr:uncharacterized protein LOC126055167 isoform X1 [Helicoverpa armigera]
MVGWIISGPVYNNRFFENSMNAVQCNLSLSFDVRHFWEIEEVDIPPVTTEEDRYCEQLFSQTTVRDQHGRFCVKMPLKQSPDCLGDSYKMAKQRFLYLEKKLDRSPQYKRMYCEFMQEYEQLGHMTRVEEGNLPKPYYIIPHHGVYRESSVTTKLRVVFDASATTSNIISLNEIQCVGPRLQNDIFSILLRFRQYRYVASADIEKFFRQTFIFPEQCNLQLIFWRTDKNLPLQIYRLNTVTYGTASAPYLSNRCLKQLAKECTDDVIASVINDDFYVDDLLVGNDKRDRLLDICSKTAAVLQSGCFPLRKWTFNFDVTSESTKDLCIGEHCQSKTLGIGWSNKNDLFYFLTSIDNNIDKKITKRLIMSVIAQIYDPLGLLAPAITTAKILLQKLWLAKISWDDEVPSEIAYTWGNFINSLQYLSDIFVPRYVMCPNAVYKELHIFSDASQTAYGAVAYIRSYNNIDESQVTSRLLCAKSKVAPIKALSIPRLELCGALVAAKLYNKIKNSLRLQFDKVYFWTDSTIVQAWVRTSPHLLKTFVQNRVVQINDLTSNTTWLHVKGKENPADILSRGVTFESMKGDNSSLWWCGPTFLCEPTSCWLPKHTNNEINLVNLPELKCSKTTTLLNVEPNNIVIDFERFSCFNRLQRTAAFMLRFIHNLRASRAG